MENDILVVKIGGREIAPGLGVRAFAAWAGGMVRAGHRLIIVHGGGDEVTALAGRLGIATLKVDGQRVTTPEVMPLVTQVLAGEVNVRLVAALRAAGLSPVGLTGLSGDLLTARVAEEGRLGQVGEPTRVAPQILGTLLGDGRVPVLAPLAAAPDGGVLNVNADLVAGAIAASLSTELLLVTDVDGVRGADGHAVDRLTTAAAEGLIASGDARDGMVPKLRAALHALAGGASTVWIGRLEDALPPASERRAGTFVVPEAPLSSLSSPPSVTVEER